MNEMMIQLAGDGELSAAYRAAHEDYLAARNAIGERSGIGAVPEIDGISAGLAHARQMPARPGGAFPGRRSGINPLGDQALAGISEWWTADRCYCDGAWDTTGEAPSGDLSRHGPQGLPDIVGRPAPVRKSATPQEPPVTRGGGH